MHLVVDKWILTTVRRGELLNDSENERLAQSDALVDTTDTTTATAATILQGESQTQSQQQHHQHQSVLIDEHIEQEQQLYQPIDEITSSSPSSCTINHHLQQHQHQHYRICSATNNTTSQTITESVRFESMPEADEREEAEIQLTTTQQQQQKQKVETPSDTERQLNPSQPLSLPMYVQQQDEDGDVVPTTPATTADASAVVASSSKWKELLVSLDYATSAHRHTHLAALVDQLGELDAYLSSECEYETSQLFFLNQQQIVDYINQNLRVKQFRLTQAGAVFQEFKSQLVAMLSEKFRDTVAPEVEESSSSTETTSTTTPTTTSQLNVALFRVERHEQDFLHALEHIKSSVKSKITMLEKHVLNWNEFDANCRHLDELFDQHSRATVDASQCELKLGTLLLEISGHLSTLKDQLSELSSVCVKHRYFELRSLIVLYELKLKKLKRECATSTSTPPPSPPQVQIIQNTNNNNNNSDSDSKTRSHHHHHHHHLIIKRQRFHTTTTTTTSTTAVAASHRQPQRQLSSRSVPCMINIALSSSDEGENEEEDYYEEEEEEEDQVVDENVNENESPLCPTVSKHRQIPVTRVARSVVEKCDKATSTVNEVSTQTDDAAAAATDAGADLIIGRMRRQHDRRPHNHNHDHSYATIDDDDEEEEEEEEDDKMTYCKSSCKLFAATVSTSSEREQGKQLLLETYLRDNNNNNNNNNNNSTQNKTTKKMPSSSPASSDNLHHHRHHPTTTRRRQAASHCMTRKSSLPTLMSSMSKMNTRESGIGTANEEDDELDESFVKSSSPIRRPWSLRHPHQHHQRTPTTINTAATSSSLSSPPLATSTPLVMAKQMSTTTTPSRSSVAVQYARWLLATLCKLLLVLFLIMAALVCYATYAFVLSRPSCCDFQRQYPIINII